MNRSKKGKKRKLFKKKSRFNYKLGWIIALIALIPIIYGVYLYCQQIRSSQKDEPKTNTSLQVLSSKELAIPISMTPQQEQIIRHTGYTVSYNKELKLPNWVSYELTREETKGKEKRNNRFIADPLVKGIIATNADYARSGYDKGHMAPAADMKWSPQAMKESFYFSNMCPQHPQLNRRGWKNLEEKIRDWAIADSAIIIICGPIITKQPKTIGKNKVAVPQQYFKVILSPFVRPMRAIGFLFNNRQALEPLSTYAVTVDSIERLTNMDFFASLPDEIENKIEAEENYFQWPN
ncbi:DNA/RNA non-specific endonuclease [Bacteroides acidifaciens]|mgnify:FL=1|jgi:endonuclease G|uniref:Nuclease n=2 Tax=Bacteroides acidifaciens TaxID=85831 RepID=A0A3L8AF46_9BACE|nr:DNA/RNA non-specific endonuclease [Bacteroides acidifaciens]MBF0731925.1 DNA/RNA non-specific endonuclease [Bacteroides acidifaciens]MBF0836457.1 DNA/RNA non-specific endonuclease [Bacteroides acidifaciens]MCR1999954.1 DNA/RNA non-specific endonuclease [Bacteroides acidifaciens]MCR2004302.1 DNA/RNA non-specific endonuclease [Bacteroides acidifaciens]NDO54313.1 DNA/RNA non-specific endonuclease [Bacteroides acidifaciens]